MRWAVLGGAVWAALLTASSPLLADAGVEPRVAPSGARRLTTPLNRCPLVLLSGLVAPVPLAAKYQGEHEPNGIVVDGTVYQVDYPPDREAQDRFRLTTATLGRLFDAKGRVIAANASRTELIASRAHPTDPLASLRSPLPHPNEQVWLWVWTLDHRWLGLVNPRLRGRVHHTTASGGKPVLGAGQLLWRETGGLRLSNRRGHYPTSPESLLLPILELERAQFDLHSIEVMLEWQEAGNGRGQVRSSRFTSAFDYLDWILKRLRK